MALWLAVACAACSSVEAPRRRVLLIGIDGATMRIARPLIDRGRLPHLAKIAEEGVSGPLRSLPILYSPRIWNSIATGKVPAKHGILSFTRRDEDGVQHLFLSSDRSAHALWNIVSDAGLSVAVINWWNTYPPERIRGVMVSDHLLPKEVVTVGVVEAPTGPLVFPEDWEPRLSALVEGGRSEPLTPFRDPFPDDGSLPVWVRLDHLSRWFSQDEAVVRFALEIEAETRPDVLMVLLAGIDRVSHALWGSLEPQELYPERLRASPAECEAGARALKGYYEYSDALIGALVERFGPDDLVVVVSDHGFEAGVQLRNHTGVHRSKAARDGVIFARGSGIPAGTPAEGVSVLDVTPSILTWLGLPVAADMDGRVAPFLPSARVEPIPTYDTGPVERVTEAPSGADEGVLEQLRDLGYIE